MKIYTWCIIPSHVHLIFCAQESNPRDILRDYKTYTSKKMQKIIEENAKESRKEWMLDEINNKLS